MNAPREWPRAALLAGWRHLRAQACSARPFRFLRPATAEPSCASRLPALPPPSPPRRRASRTRGFRSTSQSDFDARGHAWQKRTGAVNGAFDLRFEFDNTERLTFVRTASGSIIKQFAYDALAGSACAGTECEGRLVASVRHNDFGSELGDISAVQVFQYKGLGGRISRRDFSIGSTAPAAFVGAEFNHGQTWNDLGQVVSVVYPCRSGAPDCLAADGTRPVVDNGYQNGFLTSVSNFAGNITYHPNGMFDTVTHTQNGSTIFREMQVTTPDGMPRPYYIAATTPSGVELWSTDTYAYDGAGNIRQASLTKYRYDALHRLVQWSKGTAASSTTSEMVYDAFGNTLYTTHSICNNRGPFWTCTAPAILSREVSGTTNHYAGFTYDAAGNVLNDGRRAFAYDGLSMMIRAAVGGRQFRYVYTADDERVAVVELPVTVPSSGPPRNLTTWTVRSFDNQLLRSWTDDSTSGTRVWNHKEMQVWRGGSLLASVTPSATRHYALDHLGSPRAVVNGVGTLLGVQDFDPFGDGGTSDGGMLQFTAHERDAASVGGGTLGLPDYMHARYYDVGVGRFLSVDPGGMDPIKPQSWNRYAYTMNNPVKAIDPNGKETYLVIYGHGELGPQYQGMHGDQGDQFKIAAQTRASEIRSSKSFNAATDQVVVDQAGDVDEFTTLTNKSYPSGKIEGLEVFSHSWSGGLNLGGGGGVRDRGVRADNIGGIDKTNLASGATVTLWGCNAGTRPAPGKDSFAQVLANTLGVSVRAHTGPTDFNKQGKGHPPMVPANPARGAMRIFNPQNQNLLPIP